MGITKIEWTKNKDGTPGVTWNPITGCSKISPGCQNCYAERMSKRLAGRCGYPVDNPFNVTVHPDKFIEPLKWRKPRRAFVCSMGDLFHQDVKDDWILAVFVAMGLTYEHTGEMEEVSPGHHVGIYKPKHTFMILTKRPERMKEFITRLKSNEPDEEWEKKADHFATLLASGIGAPLPGNAIFEFSKWVADGMPGLWLGVTAENQEQADKRMPILLQTPAAVRFVSVEPILGPVDITKFLPRKAPTGYRLLSRYYGPNGFDSTGTQPEISMMMGLDWVICGGETGPGARPMHPDWVRSLRDQCQAAGVPFFFKQWGEFREVCRYESWPKYADHVGPTARVIGSVESGRAALLNADGSDLVNGGPDNKVYPISHLERHGKKKAGRILDGRTWEEFPRLAK